MDVHENDVGHQPRDDLERLLRGVAASRHTQGRVDRRRHVGVRSGAAEEGDDRDERREQE